MYTKESFCNLILRKNLDKILEIIRTKPYKEFSVPKKNGMRVINYLDETSELAILQKNLLINFLNKQELPVCVKGFRRGESYYGFLNPHVGAKFFLRIDIESFFPSLKKMVIKRELSTIINCSTNENKEELLQLICEIVTLNDSLPQGACTSPAMSNIVMARIDQRILKYCQIFGIKYTRYADDLLFSSSEFCFSKKKWFIKKIKYILSSNDLKLNYSKLKYSEGELGLNGYIISSNGVRLSRNRLHDIRHVVSFVNSNYIKIKEGNERIFLNEINQLKLKHRDLTLEKFQSVFQVLQYMCGYRAFIISMLDEDYSDTAFQKDLRHLIRKIEKQVIRLS